MLGVRGRWRLACGAWPARLARPGPAEDATTQSPTSAPRTAVLGPAILYGLLAAGCALAVLGPSGDPRTVHTLFEALSAQLALTIAALSAVQYVSRPRRLYLLVTVGFVGAGVLDIHHALVTSAWVVDAMPTPLERLAPWSGLAGRVYLGVFLVLAGLRLLREHQGVRSVVRARTVMGGAGVGVLATVLGFSSFEFGPAIPVGPIARPMELLAGGLMLGGLLLAMRARPWRPASFVPWLVTSMGLGGVGHFFVMPFSTELYDLPFRVAHVIKLVSYLAMGLGLLYSARAAFRAETELAARLREERRRLTEILWSTDAGTWEWDLRDDRVVLNDRPAGTLGSTTVEGGLAGLWRARCHADDLEAAEAALVAHLRGDAEHYAAEFRVRREDDSWVWILDRGKVVEWGVEGRPVRMSGTHRDITARKAVEALAAEQRDRLARDVATLQSQGRALARQAEELARAAEEQRALAAQLQREVDRRAQAERRERHLADHDPLTDLPNRRCLARLGAEAVETARTRRTKLAVLFIDIDGFKSINDNMGHSAGDLLLVAIGARLRARVRAGDVVARVGGDEFVVLLPRDCTEERAGQLAGSVVRTLAEPFDLRGARAHIGASVGVALFPEHGDTFEHLLRTADAAMYEVKQAGKGGWRVARGPASPHAQER